MNVRVKNGEQVVAEDISVEEIVNQSIENMDVLLSDIFLSDSFKNNILPKFYSGNYNNLTAAQRRELFGEVHHLLSSVLSEALLKDKVYSVDEQPKADNLVTIDMSGACFNKQILGKKNIGVTMLARYVKEARKFLISSIMQNTYSAPDFDENNLRGKAREYYDNSTSSIFQKALNINNCTYNLRHFVSLPL